VNTNWLSNDQPVDALWAGLQGIVEPDNSAFRYWFHGSVLDGETSDDSETIELGGYSLNVGLNWTTSLAMNPTFTIAVAQGTGGDRSERFRQSRLQSNNFALNGKNTFRYLGEVMDPFVVVTLNFRQRAWMMIWVKPLTLSCHTNQTGNCRFRVQPACSCPVRRSMMSMIRRRFCSWS